MPCVVLPLCQLLQRVSEFSVVWRRQRAQDINAGQQQQQAAGGAGEGEHPRRQRRRRVGRPESSRERREQRPRRGCGIQVRGSNPFLYLPRRGRGSPASTVEAAAAGAMNRSFSRSQNLRFLEGSRLVEVKSKFGAEFRRFSLNRYQPGTYEEFYQCIRQLHQIIDAELMLGYADVHGDLLPINNDDNFVKAVTSAIPLLRVFVQKQEEVDYSNFGTNTLTRRKKALVNLRNDNLRRRPHINISMPHDFRPVSSIIDVDILPETHRRVRLYRHGCEKPLGFYIRDGTSVRVTPQGLEKVPGIFISRMVPGGLADSTGLLAVNDEVLEVNGIEVAGKTLDQVTDMMIANSHNLIITVKPANQRNNIIRSSRTSGSSGQSTDSAASHHSLPPSHALQNFHPDEMESDEEADIVIEGVLEPLHIPKSHSLQSNSLSRLNGTTLSQRLQREMAHNYSGRESNGSMHKILSSLKSDPRHSLVIPRGGIEEDGTVITL